MPVTITGVVGAFKLGLSDALCTIMFSVNPRTVTDKRFPAPSPFPKPDTSLVPWLLLALMWLASMFTQAGAVVQMADWYGVAYLFGPEAERYVSELRHGVISFQILSSIPAFVFWPKWRWLLCFAMFGLCSIRIIWTVPNTVLLSPAGMVSVIVPMLLYALAASVSKRYDRLLGE